MRSRKDTERDVAFGVFGQIEEAGAIRSFLLRRLAKVKAEWNVICLTPNILKLGWYIAGRRPENGARLRLKPSAIG